MASGMAELQHALGVIGDHSFHGKSLRSRVKGIMEPPPKGCHYGILICWIYVAFSATLETAHFMGRVEEQELSAS